MTIKTLVYHTFGIVLGNPDVLVAVISFTLFSAILLTLTELYKHYKG